MTLVDAYDATGRYWEAGPGRIYNHLAEVLVDLAPTPVTGRTVLDIGSGTGAASRAIWRAGGRPVPLDVAHGMLVVDRAARPPCVVGDAAELPFGDSMLGGAVAAFALNHTLRPAAALAELRRVCTPGSPLVASAYAGDDDHPVKGIVEAALGGIGWVSEPWYDTLRRDAVPLLATFEGATVVARQAGLDADIRHVRVPMPWLTPDDMIAWRLGMAHHAPFVASLPPGVVDRAMRAARRRLGDAPPPLVRSIIVMTATV